MSWSDFIGSIRGTENDCELWPAESVRVLAGAAAAALYFIGFHKTRARN